MTRDWSQGQSSSGVGGASVDHPEFAQVCRDEHNLDYWFELEEPVLLAVTTCSCGQMTTGSLTIGLRLVGAFEA